MQFFRCLSLAAAVRLISLAGSVHAQETTYTIAPIANLISAVDLTDGGKVLGAVSNGQYSQPVIYDTHSGATTPINITCCGSGTAMNDSGTVTVIYGPLGDAPAYLYQDGALFNPGFNGGFFSINSSGIAVGVKDFGNYEQAVVYDHGKVTLIAASTANDVNAGGTVVGNVGNHAFEWSGGLVDLGTLGGPSSNATAVNDIGTVVGTSDKIVTGDDGSMQTQPHAFEYSGVMRDLGTQAYLSVRSGDHYAFVPSHLGTKSRAYDNNDAGAVIGTILNDSYNTVTNFYYDGVMHDLDPLGLTPTANNQLVIHSVIKINNRGQLLCDMTRWQGGDEFAVLTPVQTLSGDYNNNGIVDAADYVVWRDSLGQSGTGLAADGNGNGTIDNGDYDVWRANFGKTAGNGVGSAATAAVPEPASLLLLLSGTLAICSSRCPKGRKLINE